MSVFPRSRFISEFGWQSLPSFLTWRAISEPSDWAYRSELSLFRQHHDGGYDQMEAGIRRYFLFPNASDSVQLFNDTLYMTQVHQAYCYSQGIHHWRRIKQETPGNTMGEPHSAHDRRTHNACRRAVQPTVRASLVPPPVRAVQARSTGS